MRPKQIGDQFDCYQQNGPHLIAIMAGHESTPAKSPGDKHNYYHYCVGPPHRQPAPHKPELAPVHFHLRIPLLCLFRCGANDAYNTTWSPHISRFNQNRKFLFIGRVRLKCATINFLTNLMFACWFCIPFAIIIGSCSFFVHINLYIYFFWGYRPHFIYKHVFIKSKFNVLGLLANCQKL